MSIFSAPFFLINLLFAAPAEEFPKLKDFQSIEGRIINQPVKHSLFLVNAVRRELFNNRTDWKWVFYLYKHIQNIRPESLSNVEQLIKESIIKKPWSKLSPENQNDYILFVGQLLSAGEIKFPISLNELYVKTYPQSELVFYRKMFEILFLNMRYNEIGVLYKQRLAVFQSPPSEDTKALHIIYCTTLRMQGMGKDCVSYLEKLQKTDTSKWIALKLAEVHLFLGHKEHARSYLQKISAVNSEFCRWGLSEELKNDILSIAAMFYRLQGELNASEKCLKMILASNDDAFSRFFKSYELSKTQILEKSSLSSAIAHLEDAKKQMTALDFKFFKYLVELQETRINLLQGLMTKKLLLEKLIDFESRLKMTSNLELASSIPLMKYYLENGKVTPRQHDEDFEILTVRSIINLHLQQQPVVQ